MVSDLTIMPSCKITEEWSVDDKQLAAAAAKLLQSCLTLFNPIDGSPPGSTVPGILQARTLEWVAISFSNAWKWKVKVKSFSRVRLFMTQWTAASQAPPSMGFSRQEYWNGCHCLLCKQLEISLNLQSWSSSLWASLVAQSVKSLPAMWETWVRSLSW